VLKENHDALLVRINFKYIHLNCHLHKRVAPAHCVSIGTIITSGYFTKVKDHKILSSANVHSNIMQQYGTTLDLSEIWQAK